MLVIAFETCYNIPDSVYGNGVRGCRWQKREAKAWKKKRSRNKGEG